MATQTPKISGGVYLVLDPAMERNELLKKLQQALDAGVDVVQIWNSWPASYTLPDKQKRIEEVTAATKHYNIPVLINEEWELLVSTALDGVHFDSIPSDYQRIKTEINRNFICGVTCGNDLEVVEWAEQKGLDYISFCALFPSASVVNCEIVKPETIRKARRMTDLTIFVSGGITPTNLSTLEAQHIDGVAVISGVLGSDSPGKAVTSYKKVLQKNKFINL